MPDLTGGLRARLAHDSRLDGLSASELDAVVAIVQEWRWPPDTAQPCDREPKPGQVWREKARQYRDRTVAVVGIVDGNRAGKPGRFVQVRTITGYDGRPVNRKAITKVRVENWHKQFVFDRETMEATTDARAN